MRRSMLTIFLFLFSVPLLAAPSLLVLVSTNPGNVINGNALTVNILIQNNGSTQVNGVLPSINLVAPYAGALGSLTVTAGPLPVTATVLPAGMQAAYTFVYQGLSCGDAGILALASGTEEGSGQPVYASGPLVTVGVLCPTATPTVTPWIIFETPTPAPQQADAGVRGNVFRPGGPPVEFDFSVAQDSKVVIRIFDRNGKIIRSIVRDVSAGHWVETWDGRTEDGSLAATGIYMVHFMGKGLNKQAKIAFIK